MSWIFYEAPEEPVVVKVQHSHAPDSFELGLMKSLYENKARIFVENWYKWPTPKVVKFIQELFRLKADIQFWEIMNQPPEIVYTLAK